MSELIEVACKCGKPFKAKPEHAGRTGKCAGCGAAVEIPFPQLEFDAHFDPAPAFYPRKPFLPPIITNVKSPESEAVTLKVQQKVESPASEAVTVKVQLKGVPAEPWYYKAFWFVGAIIIIPGLVVGVFSLFGLIVALFRSPPQSGNDFLILGGMAAYSLGFVIVTMLLGGAVLMAVDIARNIRGLRFDRSE